MLTPQQRAAFDAQGFIRLGSVFSRDEAAAMEERLWSALARKHGVAADDPATWNMPLGSGLQRLRNLRVFEPIGGPALRAALDDLIGPGRWEVPKHWGQFLVSFPVGEGTARSRAVWHTDFPFALPADRVVGALVVSFLAEVPPGTGGTLVMAGSPKLVARFVSARPHLRTARMKVTRQALLRSDPWLQSLGGEWTEDDWTARLPEGEHRIDGLPLRIVELTGAPGDVVVGHPWLIHSPSPNRGDRPRFMRVQRIRPAPHLAPDRAPA